MRGKEPFRSLVEEARAAERKPQQATPAPAPPLPLAQRLDQRLDQMVLAGGTPARGTLIPMLAAGYGDAPARHAATDDLFAALDMAGEPTRQLPAGAAVDAALRDSLAELEATIEIPAQRRMAAREPVLTSDVRQAAAPVELPAEPALDRPIVLQGVPRTSTSVRPRPRVEPVATHAPPPMMSEAAPPPRVLQVLGEENTIPGLPPAPRSSSSDKVARTSDRYRLQLEFEDTPARPLPRVAYVPPPPLPPSAKRPPMAPAAAPKSTDVLADLQELEAIDDLRAMAKALGLDGVGDVSIPSLEGLPVLDDAPGTVALPSLPELDQLIEPAPRKPRPSEVRRALVLEALDDSVEAVFPDKRAGAGSAPAPRPALGGGRVVAPVIVKIPSRPKVSLEARERARRLYLSAVDLLGKGERTAAMQHLRMAIELDDGIQLYRDLLEHLAGPAAAPALTVLGRDGSRSAARDHWRSARPR